MPRAGDRPNADRGVPHVVEARPVRAQGRGCASDPPARFGEGARQVDRRGDRRAACVLQDGVRVRRLTDRDPGRGRAGGPRAAASAVDWRIAGASARTTGGIRGVARVLGLVRDDRGLRGRLVRSQAQADRRRRQRASERAAADVDPRVRARVGDRLSALFAGAGRGDGHKTATHLAAASVGLDISGESVPYVAGWGENGALEAVTAFAARIDELARRIETVLAAESTGQSAAP